MECFILYPQFEYFDDPTTKGCGYEKFNNLLCAKKKKINNLLHVLIPSNLFSRTLDCFNFDISLTVRFGGGEGRGKGSKERNPNSSSPKSCVVGFKYGINHNVHQSKY